MRVTWMMTLVAASLVACQQGETPEARERHTQAVMDSARTAVRNAAAQWSRWNNAGHPDSILTLFASGGMMMPPDMPAMQSHDSMMMLMRAEGGSQLTITSQDIAVSDPIALDRGVFSVAIPAMGRTPAQTVTGKYMVHYHHVGSDWKIAAIAWSNDKPVPLPPMGSPAPRH